MGLSGALEADELLAGFTVNVPWLVMGGALLMWFTHWGLLQQLVDLQQAAGRALAPLSPN